jgi:hypothetical protein
VAMTPSSGRGLTEFLATESGDRMWVAEAVAKTRGKVRQYVCGETGDSFYDTLRWRIRKVGIRPVYPVEIPWWRAETGWDDGGIECPLSHPDARPYWRIDCA